MRKSIYGKKHDRLGASKVRLSPIRKPNMCFTEANATLLNRKMIPFDASDTSLG